MRQVILKDKVTILLCSCDSYSDLWPPFFTLLKKFWPENDCRIILNTETKSFSFDGLKIESYHMGNTFYGTRMLNHLDKIETPYTLLLLDDFFIRRPVNVSILTKLIEKMDSNSNIASMCFNENPYFDKSLEPYYGFVKLAKFAPYKLNMQAGVWRTDRLKYYWAPRDNPWFWEIFVNYLTFESPDEFYALIDKEQAPIYYGYNTNGMGVYRGKWVIEDVKPLFDEHGISIDYSKRGYYVADKEIQRLPILKTMPYVFKRIPLNYALGFSLYEIWKRILRLFGREPKYLNFTNYLSRNK